MLLSDRDIKSHVKSGLIVVLPFDENMIQPSSIDVCLDNEFLTFPQGGVIDPTSSDTTRTIRHVVDWDDYFLLHPQQVVLASTVEVVGLSGRIAARLEGKSSLGRLGLMTHVTAGFIDPGFQGNITLELVNVNNRPIKLYPGMKIGQLCFFEMSSDVDSLYGSVKYGSHYQGQTGPVSSRSHENFYRMDNPHE